MMSIVEMSVRFSPQQDELMKEISRKTKKVECFEFEGVLFKGNRLRAIMDFVWNNPTGGDFYVWLQDRYKIIQS